MQNKVLIHVMVPELASDFDVFIPVNEVIWKIQLLLLKSVCDLCHIEMNPSLNYYLMNKDTNRIYNSNEIVIDTDIRNGTEILLISKDLSG